MGRLITPTELPDWLPGEVVCASDALGWCDVAMRGYRYLGQDVYIPPMRDYMIVSYRRGLTPMERRFDGAWTQTRCAPGSLSLLTRAQRSNWNWSEHIEVSHVYLTEDLLAKLASEALDKQIADVRLRDVLKVEDPVLTAGVEAIQREAATQSFGGKLYVEAIATQLSLHLLRNYAELRVEVREDQSRLSALQRRRIADYVDAHLEEALALQTLASVAGLGLASFTRRFRASFGCAPHAWVMTRRVERARRLLAEPRRALKQIASDCGFADQAHMTRVFRARLGTTPGALRAKAAR
ncbi:MAG TPA: AraC family transcriptional regulator [Gammaproteobacteria bacterium]|nr:AraC family transcriptional regulator [Gammaproteobacteria bacterium]